MLDLKKLRQEVDRTDEKLLRVLAKRFEITRQVGEHKKKHNLLPLDKARETEVFQRRKLLADKFNLDVALVEQIFKLVIKNVRKNHQKIKQGKN